MIFFFEEKKNTDLIGNDEHGDLGAILAGVKHLLNIEEGGIQICQLGGPEHLRGWLGISKVISVDDSWLGEGGELEEHCGVLLSSSESNDRS